MLNEARSRTTKHLEPRIMTDNFCFGYNFSAFSATNKWVDTNLTDRKDSLFVGVILYK